MMSLIAYCLCKRYYVVCSGLTSLSTIFQSYITMVSGCDREQNAHFYSAASLKYHALDTWHDTTLSHIILTLGRPVLALPRKSKCQARCSWYHFLRLKYVAGSNPRPPVPRSRHSTNWATGAGKRYYTRGIIDRTSCNFILFIEYFERVTLFVA